MDAALQGPLSEAANVVTLPRKEALAKYNEYKQAVRIHRTQHDKMMKAVYQALSAGLGVINPRQAIIKAGLDAEGYPKLAIARADLRVVYFKRHMDNQNAFYAAYENRYISNVSKTAQKQHLQFHFSGGELPAVTPKMVQHGTGTNTWMGREWPTGYYDAVKTLVPVVPPVHRPVKGLLHQFCILWEVDKWERTLPPRPPGDPMLLKPLSETGLYAVVAHWDLTAVERMVLGAMAPQLN